MCSCRTRSRSGGARPGFAHAYGLRGLYPLDNAVDLRDSDASLTIFKG